ncbi:hypothetical protein [Amycolatopsis sp. NPDC051102]|uniref:hypothetical protein n=1 Tax=Amycolatopsis sp. NPDC051102 TaxID=3155163 RepID=UPI00342AF0C9
MRIKHRVASVLLTACGLAAPLAAPPAASAATAAYSDFCATGTVKSLADRLPIEEVPYGTVVGSASKGNVLACWQNHYTLSNTRYTACGVSNANGWLYVQATDGNWGWTYMTCLADV